MRVKPGVLAFRRLDVRHTHAMNQCVVALYMCSAARTTTTTTLCGGGGGVAGRCGALSCSPGPAGGKTRGARELQAMSEEETAVAPRGVNAGGGAVEEVGDGAELVAAMEQAAASEGVRALHARVEAEWGPVLQSACQTAAARALWAQAVRDPAAGVMAGERLLRGLREKVRREERAGARETPGVMVAVRTLWFDARIAAAVAALGGAAQVVLLGAGMDARTYRLSCLKDCTVFELDFPELLEMKADLLREAMNSGNHQKLTMMAKSLIRVPADIREEDWITKLQRCGYVPERNTIWVLEGIIYYLHHVHAMQVLETIAACRTSACTVLLADFMNKNATMISRTMYHFYHDNPDILLPSIGFSQATLSQIGDPQAHFGLLNHPDNLFDKLRKLPRSVQTNPEDGTPCCRLYLVEASASPHDQTTI